MDFDLNEDQSLLRDSVERLTADLYPSLESRQARLKAPLGFPAEGWTAFTELGVTGLPFSEEEGGFGGGPVEFLLVMEAVGRNLVVGNLVYSLVLGMSVPDVSGSAIANLEVESLKHPKPSFHGDTIWAETRVVAVSETSDGKRGVVTVDTSELDFDESVQAVLHVVATARGPRS